MIILQVISWLTIFAMFYFYKRRDIKISIVMVCTMLLSMIYLSPTTTSVRNICILCFCLSELRYLKSDFGILKRTIVGKTLLIVLISHVISYFSSPHLFGNAAGTKDLIVEIVSCDFLIAYSYLSFRKRKDLGLFYKVLFGCLVILTFFAIVNFLFMRADFVNYAAQNSRIEMGNIGDKYSDGEGRFRVQAMFTNPFDYGYLCLVCLGLELYAFLRKIQKKKYSYIAFFCCLFGIFTCGCRTVIVCFFIGLLCLLLLLFSKNYKKISYAILGVFVLLLLYNTVPVIQNKIDMTFTAFTDKKGDKVGGSNLNMRQQQINAVFFHIKDNLLLGRGVGYFRNDLGFDGTLASIKDGRLMALEGVYMVYLLERGFVGLSLWILYYLILLLKFYKMRMYERYSSGIGITVIVMYISFGCMTGQLLSLYPTLLSLGVFMKICYANKKRKKTQLVRIGISGSGKKLVK